MDDFIIREATVNDLREIIALLAADELGSRRESISSTALEQYRIAFINIAEDPNNTLLVGCLGREVIGTFQLTLIQNMTYKGGIRAQIEGVRVKTGYRGKQFGEQMIHWAINKAKQAGCKIVQLTTNRQRPQAIKFYENLGFTSSHAGMKLFL